MCKFANIHNHTDIGSFDAVLTADAFIDRVKNLNQEYVVQTDHGTMRGMIGLAKKARKAGLKYIPGVEVYVTLGERPKREADVLGRKYYHMLLIAKNKTGLKNLFNLHALSYKDDDHFYYKPRVSLDEIGQYSEGLIATTGCIASPLSTIALLEHYGSSRFLESKDLNLLRTLYVLGLSCDDHFDALTEEQRNELQLDRALHRTLSYEKLFDQMLGIFGDDLYGEVQDCGESDQDIVNKRIIEVAKRKGIPVIATSDAHYATPEDAQVRELMMRIRHKQLDLGDNNEFYQGGRLHLKSGQELGALFGEEAISNTIRLVESCEEIQLERSTLFPVPSNYSQSDRKPIFQKLIIDGLKSRGISKDIANFAQYLSRAQFEFKTICDLGFLDYFLVLKDVLDKARAEDILIGPGRGSVAGSLVAYALGITEVDPIKYGLYFSRFLNKDRVSLPDADLDLPSSKRDRFIQLVVEQYGSENVCQIMTFLEMKPKSIARDLGRIFKTPDIGDEIAKLIPPPLHGREPSVKEALEQTPKLSEPRYSQIVSLMLKLETLSRTSGVHAGGVIIAPTVLKDIVPIEYKKDRAVVGLSMNEIEYAGLIKFDFLGLRNLDIVDETIKAIGIKNPYIEIPIDDEATFEMITQSKDFGGLFQFEGSIGIGDLLRNIQPKSIEDIAVATALYRPAALNSKLDKLFLERRKIDWKPESKLDLIIPETYGLMIYQEQCMKVATQLAGFTESEADSLRKIIGKKLKDEVSKWSAKFIEGCESTSKLSRKEASDIWDVIAGAADYGFNLSHSVSK